MNNLTKPKMWDLLWKKQNKFLRNLHISTFESNRILAYVLKKVPENGKILELGGAPGNIAKRCFDIRPDIQIDCVDYSHIGCEIIRSIYKIMGIKGEIYESDITKFKKNYNNYDLVLSCGLIEHFKYYKKIIEIHFNFVKLGGYVFITIPNFDVFPVRKLLYIFSNETVETHNFKCMNINALKSVLKDIGVTDIETGLFGASILPNTLVNKGIGGYIYKRLAQTWNLFNSVLYKITNGKLVIRLWYDQIYIMAKKKV